MLNSNGPCRTFQKFSGFGQCWGSACFWASRIRIHQSEVPIWIRIRLRIWLRIFPFSHKKTEDNVPVGRLLEKNMKKIFFCIPKSHLRKESDPELDPDPKHLLVRRTIRGSGSPTAGSRCGMVRYRYGTATFWYGTPNSIFFM